MSATWASLLILVSSAFLVFAFHTRQLSQHCFAHKGIVPIFLPLGLLLSGLLASAHLVVFPSIANKKHPALVHIWSDLEISILVSIHLRVGILTIFKVKQSNLVDCWLPPRKVPPMHLREEAVPPKTWAAVNLKHSFLSKIDKQKISDIWLPDTSRRTCLEVFIYPQM